MLFVAYSMSVHAAVLLAVPCVLVVIVIKRGSCWVYQAAREVLLGDSRRTASQLQSSLVRHCPLSVAVTMLPLVMGICVAHCRCIALQYRVLRVSVCHSQWSPAVMHVAGRPGVLCSGCCACCVCVCFTDVCVTACDAAYDVCAHDALLCV
jgi:hypothetical protein